MPPNACFSSAAGRFHEARRASARDRVIHNAQVVGRASGVCCERCWAAGVGMRNLRLSGMSGGPAARYVRRSGMPGCPVCPAARYVRRSGCPVCPAARLPGRLPGMPGCPVCPAVRYARLPVLFPILVTSGDTNIVAVRVSRRLRWMHSARVSEATMVVHRGVTKTGNSTLPGMPGCPVCPAARLFDGAVRVEGSPTPASAAPLAASVDRGARRHATAP